MESFKILLAVALLATASSTPTPAPATSSGELPKPSYTRTMLKVSRSLPGETEELKVRTSEGNLATLIVKRREKLADDAASRAINAAPVPSAIGFQNVEVDPWVRRQTWNAADRQKSRLPQESKTWTSVNRGEDSWRPVGQSFADLDSAKPTSWLVADNLESSRSFQSDPGEGSFRYTFFPHEPQKSVRPSAGDANLPKDRDAKKVPAEVVVRSEINVKPQPGQQPHRHQQQQQQQQQRHRPQSNANSERLPMTIDPDGIPVVHGRRVPDEPIDKFQVWRNARVINDQLVTDPSAAASTASVSVVGGGSPESGQSFERFFEDVNRRYIKSPDEDALKSNPYRNEILAAEIYETAADTYRPSIRKRMLQPELGTAVYPNSRLYSPPVSSAAAAAAAAASPSVKPGTRAPVLQYAHPELGVQPAKIAKTETRKSDAASSTESPAAARQQQQQQQQQQQHGNQQQNGYGEYRQRKKYVLNDKNLVDSYAYKNYYPNQQFYGVKRPTSEPPFWIRISENLKHQFTDGVAKVSELTKPVFDPLMEATRKISENLGLSNSRSRDHAQDKIGTVASSSSVLIPALGLVASGAALGIGAVAVGRYLDVDVLKRSNEAAAAAAATASGLRDEDNRRALGIVSEIEEAGATRGTEPRDGEVYILVRNEERDEGAGRRKRNVENDDADERRAQRKGADSIEEIVEIDLPTRQLDDPTVFEGYHVQLENEDAIAQSIVQQTLDALSATSQLGKEESRSSEPRTRRRRSPNDAELEDVLQNLENAEIAEVGSGHVTGDWTNTPCAKRIFCDAMVQRGSDAYMFMEKKMAGLLRMIQPTAAAQVSAHFDEVMDAVRRHDCSIFSCPQARPANVFF